MSKLKQELEGLRQKDAASLKTQLAEARIALQKARIDAAFSRLQKTSTIATIRKQIARLQTLLNEKEMPNA
jgi:ribosomal protein L29